MPTTTPLHVDFRTVDGVRIRYVRRYPEELPQLAELLPYVKAPVRIINGRHFIWEEAPDEYASIVIDSIEGRAITA